MFEPGDWVRRDADKREGRVINVVVAGAGPPGNYLVEWVKVIWDGDQSSEDVRPEELIVIRKR